MDLKIEDVANLFNVPVTTIHHWLEKGEIPAYRIGEQFLFNREEIENWLMNRKNQNLPPPFPFEKDQKGIESPLAKKTGMQKFSLYRSIHNGEVYHDIEGNTKEEVIRNTSLRIASILDLDKDVLTELLLDRESLMPTSIDHGIAIPHARDFLLQAHYDMITVVFPKAPLSYGALDGKPVHTLFFLFACEDKRHLHLLAKIAHLSRNEEALSFLKTKPNKEILLDYIKEWEKELMPV